MGIVVEVVVDVEGEKRERKGKRRQRRIRRARERKEEERGKEKKKDKEKRDGHGTYGTCSGQGKNDTPLLMKYQCYSNEIDAIAKIHTSTGSGPPLSYELFPSRPPPSTFYLSSSFTTQPLASHCVTDERTPAKYRYFVDTHSVRSHPADTSPFVNSNFMGKHKHTHSSMYFRSHTHA